MDTASRSTKLRDGHPWVSRHHSNLSRSMFLRRSRHHYSQHYFRRNTSSCSDILTTPCKTVASLDDERLTSKLFCCESQSGCHEVSKEKAFCSLERVRSNAFEGDLAPFDMEKIVCGICLKLLKRKPSSSLANIMPTIYNSVVAVLACAHVYHADCLEQRRSEADRWDPPCPMCTNNL